MRFSGRIKSPQNSEHAQYSDATECDPIHQNVTHEQYTNVLQRFT